MPLTRIPIYVPDVNTQLEDFEKIQVHRSDTKYGTYEELTTCATRIDLVEDQVNYELEDEEGNEFYWYKWRFYSDSSTLVSRFYEPVQGYTVGLTYCTFESIKRNLKSNAKTGRIRFSDNYKNLTRNKRSTGTIVLREISINPDYYGEERFAITFTDVDEFTVTVSEETASSPRNIGTGETGEDFTSTDNNIKVKSDDWSGTAVIGDIIEFQTESHMSINDAIRFAQDAEVFTDMILEENIGYTTEKRDELRFTIDDVPKAIRIATSKFAAFFIHSTIYNVQALPGVPGSINDISNERRYNDLATWLKQGFRYIEGYIAKYTKFFNPEDGTAVINSPRWMAMDALFDAVGVQGVGEGLKMPDIDTFKDSAQMSYDGLLDYDLMAYANADYVSTVLYNMDENL